MWTQTSLLGLMAAFLSSLSTSWRKVPRRQQRWGQERERSIANLIGPQGAEIFSETLLMAVSARVP